MKELEKTLTSFFRFISPLTLNIDLFIESKNKFDYLQVYTKQMYTCLAYFEPRVQKLSSWYLYSISRLYRRLSMSLLRELRTNYISRVKCGRLPQTKPLQHYFLFNIIHAIYFATFMPLWSNYRTLRCLVVFNIKSYCSSLIDWCGVVVTLFFSTPLSTNC